MITWIMTMETVTVMEALAKELENLDTMTGPNLPQALSDLPVQHAGTASGMSVAEAITLTFCESLFIS
jgi:hypothetical protein